MNNKGIFKVIKSMTMNEKRYFKIFCKQHTLGDQNKYVLIFDLMTNIENYDDNYLKTEIKKKNYSIDYFSADLNYLERIIYKSLNEFHSEKTCDLKIKQNLITIEILFYKGLYDKCLDIIKKTKRIKLAKESQFLLLDVINWEKKCIGYSKGLLEAKEINESLNTFFDELNYTKTINDLYYKSYILKNSTGKVSSEVVESEFEKLLEHNLLNLTIEKPTIHDAIFSLLVYCNYYHVKKDKVKEMEYLRNIIKIFDSNESYKYEKPLDYISVYSRIIDINKREDTDKFYSDLHELKSFNNIISLQNDVAIERIFLHTSQAELEHLLNNNNLEAANVLMQDIQEKYLKNKFNVEPYYLISLYYLFASIYCAMDNFSKGLRYINLILNEFKFSDRPKTFIKAEFLNIVIHYELKNYVLAQKSIVNLNKKYKNNFKFNIIEKEIINSINKIIDNPHIANRKNIFTKAKNTILSNGEIKNFKYHDLYMIYIDKKINSL